ncbi:MAG: DUF116 domain-containing protein [Nitrospirae bacterium]|nr:DUF116 domain-containing protein [Nitrospirota bacterium]
MWVKWLRGLVLKVYYPLLMLLGAFFKDKKESFQRHIINLNNKLVIKQGIQTRKILLMLPHCLQVDKCDIRITNNIYNCKRCGRCGVKDLIGLSEEKQLELYMATGGSVARKIVIDVRPHAIVAVACERDLSSGIVDSYPLPVIGIHNDRPYGPCYNTSVNIEKVAEAINALCP